MPKRGFKYPVIKNKSKSQTDTTCKDSLKLDFNIPDSEMEKMKRSQQSFVDSGMVDVFTSNTNP